MMLFAIRDQTVFGLIYFTYYFFILNFNYIYQSSALLFVQQNELRGLDMLDGLWTFVREPSNSDGIGFRHNWASRELSSFKNSTLVPVPCAFNDLAMDKEQRDHVGWVWYQREYRLSKILLRNELRRSFLRFGSVQYTAILFLNGKFVGQHTGGHLPFEFEVPLSNINVITVAVNNTLSDATIPPGDFRKIRLSSGHQIVEQTPNFDFFNYAGILRSVYLLHLPRIFINRIKIKTNQYDRMFYQIDVDHGSSKEIVKAHVEIYFEKSKKPVISLDGLENATHVPDAKLWWPRGMGEPNLYLAEVSLLVSVNGQDEPVDVYRETFGFRTVKVDEKRIYINGRPFYCHGFGMHEDFEVHGRGFDRAVMVKDLNMFEWLHGNCYRTSHYPYSEERAYEADRRGIAVITEVPAVGIRQYTRKLQQLHAQMITEMVERDRNHPSVVMWSLANEPDTRNGKDIYEYFSELVYLTKLLDNTRPVTIVFGGVSTFQKVAHTIDVICLNRYFGWYSNIAMLGLINDSLTNEILEWRKVFNKPVVLSEYGAEAIAGLNEQPSVAFSEQYQAELVQITGETLDRLRQSGEIAGEMLWNFADFMTAQNIERVVGNHKGVLTRNRKPKLGAYTIRKRYGKLLLLMNEADENEDCSASCQRKFDKLP